MTSALYLKDSYLKEINARINLVENETEIHLDQTLFSPQGGGQPADKGSIFIGTEEYKVLDVKKKEGSIIHLVDKPGLLNHDHVLCKLNWERRYTLMRMHTAAHLLCSIFNKEAKTLITGNQLDITKSRIDFNLENFNKEQIQTYFDKANKLIQQGADIKISTLPREQALAIPDVVKLAGALPPDIAELRIVEIEGIDIQADGGTHVHNIKEIKGVSLLSAENKGKNNRRIYFTLEK